MRKPTWLFDRDREWAALSAFAIRERPGLAIVRGRRRHGKSALLRAVADARGAFYHQAVRGLPIDQRRDLARAWSARFGGPEPAFASWQDAVDALLSPPTGEAAAVVLDELPYLTESAPQLESILQRARDARRSQQQGVPLVLCGSARAVMTRLLVGNAPLRGRAQLELDVAPFGFREAAAFTGLPPEIAFPVHAVVGGIPGYAVDLLDRTYPEHAQDVERWLVEVAVSPTRPLIHEARSLVELEPGVREPATYLSVLGAIASGATRAGEIAGLLGRSTDVVAHALATLDALGLVTRSDDLLRRGRPSWSIADPLLRLYAALLRPRWELVERADPRRLASALADPWRSQVLGPHLETLSREWVLSHADADALGGFALRVGPGTVADPTARVRHEVDVVAVGEHGRVLAVGEAKLRTVDHDDLRRLVQIRDLVRAGSGRDDPIRLLLFSATGFTPGLQAEDTELVDLKRLYEGG